VKNTQAQPVQQKFTIAGAILDTLPLGSLVALSGYAFLIRSDSLMRNT
jgi:hypothetical protein